MSQFVLSCTSCATRMPGRDEISDCFTYAPQAGYKAWGVAGPLFWTPGLPRWVNFDLLNQRAAAAGLTRCTEVYGPGVPTASVAEGQRAAPGRALGFDAAEKQPRPRLVFTGPPPRVGGLARPIARV